MRTPLRARGIDVKYLCLIYNEERTPAVMPEHERRTLPGEALAYWEDLWRKGHFVAAHALEPGHTSTTVRVRNGRLSAREGPVAKIAAELRGVVVIEARDLNEAIRVASQMPEARRASIEVRPVRDSE
jgi:hypothetical protein